MFGGAGTKPQIRARQWHQTGVRSDLAATRSIRLFVEDIENYGFPQLIAKHLLLESSCEARQYSEFLGRKRPVRNPPNVAAKALE